jgi:hypothetical protein
VRCARGCLQNSAHSIGQRIGHRARRIGHGQSNTAQIVILVVVGVPAAVILLQIEIEDGAGLVLDRLFEIENRLARLIAQTRAGIDAPRRIVAAVDGVLDRPGDAAIAALVVELLLEDRFGRVEIGCRAGDLHLGESLPARLATRLPRGIP